MYANIITPDSMTIVIDGIPEVITRSHINFDRIREALKAGRFSLIHKLIDTKNSIRLLTKGKIEVFENEVRYDGKPLAGRLVENLLAQLREGFDVSPLINFLEKLKQNPRFSIVQELYEFIEGAETITLHPDGDILAYKLVRDDYMDIYSGTVDNSVGQKLPRLEPNEVDDNRQNVCSSGYHFCSAGYLGCYGPSNSRVVIVKVNPADIVAIPTDHGFAKGRATTYQILAEVPRDKAAKFFETVGPVYSPQGEETSWVLIDDFYDLFDEDEDEDEGWF